MKFDHEDIPLHWVNRLGFLVRKELAQAFREAGHDVSAEEWAVLLVLWSRGAQTPSHLANMTIRDRTTITRLVDGMVAKKLAQRREDPADRRRSLIGLGCEGERLRPLLIPIAQSLIARAVAGISGNDLTITVRTLRQMTQNLMPER